MNRDVQYEIEQFLFTEADLLDEWQLDEWLSMLADDIRYWAPTRQNRLPREAHLATSDETGTAYFDDGKYGLVLRVRRLQTGLAWAENPQSRTRHLVTNVRVFTRDDGAFDVRSNFFVFRTRLEREADSFVGQRRDTLRRVDNEWGWEIAQRTILFDVATMLAKNITFFV